LAEKDLKENPFRDEIYNYLLSHGYAESHPADYDYKNALDTAKLFEFLEKTQGDELAKFKTCYGSAYQQKYIGLLCQKIDNRGLLTALDEWVEDYASNTKFSLAYFQTGLKAMTDGIKRYEGNIFSVRREFAYEDKENSFRVDLALFLNGIPIVMIELKKQTAGQKAGFEGTKQFRTTRNPQELVFSFNKRTLAYFAVDELVAFVTTKLDKQETSFMPFNIGVDDGAGNPVVEGKHCTAYLWEEILQKDMLLRIIREFMFIDDEGALIFPRYHQLRAVLRGEADVKEKGIGGRYLFWHSAGSGKTKTIAWLAKRLINNQDINTVIIISDRTVIDGQLAAELKNVDGAKGVAKHIDTTSKQLLKMLGDGGYIIVTTLQKFRPILDEIKRIENRNYAIIIDEAHSSTAGKSMSKASETLTGKSLKDAAEIDAVYEELEDDQNQILKNAAVIRATNNVSYFAFTATPKKETMELFGTRTEQGKSYFDKYSMKQAIEERYIINPLLCYTNYSDKYEIKKKKDDESEYESSKAQAAILNFVTTTPEVIETKVQIMMDDFIEKRINWLGGKAKAMIVTPSRKHAVCYKLAVDRYLKKHGSAFRSCVAFTGTIELDGVKYTEEDMNKEFIERGIPYDIKAIIKNHDDLRIIIVADKLQTGFDENKLCIMYVDKKLGSAVKAVQTLSRLNRPEKNKHTFILDFVNKADEIKAYFVEYYGGEIYLPMENEMDPNILFIKRDRIVDYGVIDLLEAQKLYDLIADSDSNAGTITATIASIRLAFDKLDQEKQRLFVAELKKFTQLFYYISAVYNSWNEDMKRLAIVFDVLYNVLFEKEVIPAIDAEDLIELVEFSTKIVYEDLTIELEAKELAFEPASTYVTLSEQTFSLIDEIIEKFNLRYANAEQELQTIVSVLSSDEMLMSNVRDSSPSAYESAVAEKVSESITDGLLDGTISGDEEKAAFYTELSNNKIALAQLSNAVIRKIKDMLLAG